MPFRIRKPFVPPVGPPAASFEARLEREFGLRAADVSPAARRALAALAAERDALAEKLASAEAAADSDALTGARNRRGFLRELHRTMSEVERYRTPAAVLYLDLDGFKALNDGFGHAAGDAALRQIGRLLVDQVRESDVVGRLGGDEFGIILNRMPAEEARVKAQAIVDAIHKAPVHHADMIHRVTASIGVHIIRAVEDPETALARADEAMYADKHARRERERRFANF